MLLALPGPAFVLDTVHTDAGTHASRSMHTTLTTVLKNHACCCFVRTLLASGTLDAFYLASGARVLLRRAADLASEHHTVRTASSVWDASLQLARCLERQSERADDGELRVAGKRVIELVSQNKHLRDVPRKPHCYIVEDECKSMLAQIKLLDFSIVNAKPTAIATLLNVCPSLAESHQHA